MEKIFEKGENFIDHYRKLEEDLDTLKSECRVLKRRKIDINSRIETEVRLGQAVKEDVKGWLEDVQKMEEDIQDVEERVHSVSRYNRISLDILVREKIEEVKRIQDRGNFNEGLVIETAPPRGIMIPTEKIEGEISTKDEIQKHLMDDKVGMIGVCGIGGVGKTTIMKHINNALLSKGRFQKVIWVTVSYPLNVLELQKKIALAMGKTLPEDEEKMIRAAALMDIMGSKSFVLILDDLWEKFSLTDVGIPEPVQNKSKVVITSRSVEVCNYLDCKIVKVQPLSPQESLSLFLDRVGRDVLQKVSGLEETLKLIVEECDGLPLAIVVIAGSMKGEYDIAEWRNALNELRQCVRSVKCVEDEIFGRLRFSYDRLRSLQIQECFLYCSLFREDYEFFREYLIEDWIDEGLIVIDEWGSRQAAYDRGRAFLNRLLQNCLLEECVGSDRVKMHDVVRDMAIKSIGLGCGYMVKAGMKLKKVPNESEWEGDLKKSLECRMEVQDFNYLVNKSKDFDNLTAYEFRLTRDEGEIGRGGFFDFHQRKVSIHDCEIGEECIVLPDTLEGLWICNCKNMKNMRCSLNKTVLLENATELRRCFIEDFEGIECIVELDSSSSSLLNKLEDLSLHDSSNLSVLVRVEGVVTPPQIFSNLKYLWIRFCSAMRNLVPLELLQALQNLQSIQFRGCEQMEEIIASSDSDASSSNKFTFTFPNLRTLILVQLGQLKSICGDKGVMVCDSIEEIQIIQCPKLKRFPLQLPLLDNGEPSPPRFLKKIGIDEESKEWWESVVELNHPNAKNILQPFLKFTPFDEWSRW
ncbi:hypothetical protein SLEP1_g58550 [Rubroshorea leprosula]|uniref:NB-ARC domain-containing protein n=1 Tax=Rubroshorea leprosula TaxID=152421 RepID=A0AAV5MTR8_9ROSI|nr:hypothetical protein SLEP1_g58550 [Rubroshorea leprosula]